MTSLRSVLAFNMKVQRKILGISQAQLAEKVDTSTHYIGMIESEKKFPTPEMLERIAAALEIDAPALFSTNSYPKPEAGTMADFQEQVLNDITQVLAYRIAKLDREPPPDCMAGADKAPKMT
ncbi:MAG: helix-turn-helix domain-containing protein [Treponema sp.]|jgi:transcriptional regulator with XRE-family HTH domain|nr:helix-turn-helix domain-containing protein [Treponema sp.]